MTDHENTTEVSADTAAETTQTAAASAEAAPTPAPAEEKVRGRASKHNGKSLYPSSVVMRDGNPRRVGSYGHTSMAVIIDNPGINVDEFVKAGGRIVDLNWDVDHGHVAFEQQVVADPVPVVAPAATAANTEQAESAATAEA